MSDKQRHADQLAKWCGYHGLTPPTGEVVDAFCEAMGDKNYGVEETWDAYCWFQSGFNAAASAAENKPVAWRYQMPGRSTWEYREYPPAGLPSGVILQELFALSATRRIPGAKIAMTYKQQRDELATILHDIHDRGLILGAMTRGRVEKALEKIPTYEQQLRNIAKGLDMTYEELIAGIEANAADSCNDIQSGRVK